MPSKLYHYVSLIDEHLINIIAYFNEINSVARRQIFE